MPVGPLGAVLGFLSGAATAVGSGDVFLFLGLGFHTVVVAIGFRWAAKHHAATADNLVDIHGVGD